MGRVVLIACTNVGRSMIEAIMNSPSLTNISLAGIVNLKPEAAIEKANYDSYIDLVKKYSLNAYYCENVNETDCVRFLNDCKPDIIIQSGWSQKFKQEILDIPRFACIGEHPAPLPKGRGAACINWAIITGEHEWGDTFFKMETDYDTGAIYSQEHFTIEIYDDVKTVYDKVAKVSVNAIEKHLPDWVEGNLDGHKQNDAEATHYPRRRPSDGEFKFQDDSALNIYNHIRGQAKPYPGAFFYFNPPAGRKASTKIYVWKARLGKSIDDNEIGVQCKDGEYVIIQRVQAEGDTEQWAADYFKDYACNKVLNIC